jgi:hypothetical protein
MNNRHGKRGLPKGSEIFHESSDPPFCFFATLICNFSLSLIESWRLSNTREKKKSAITL